MENYVWLIGKLLNNEENEAIGWMAEGVFYEEEKAVENCKEGEFVLCVKIGEMFPEEAIDAYKMYYPCCDGCWEESPLYLARNGDEEMAKTLKEKFNRESL